MATELRVYRGSAADWASNNSYLEPGEIGENLDDQSIKVGNGDPWNTLNWPYIKKDVLTTKGDLLISRAAQSPTRLPAGTPGQRLAIGEDSQLYWVDSPDISTLEYANHALTTYVTNSLFNYIKGILELRAHAATTYQLIDDATVEHDAFEPSTHFAATYLTKATAASTYEPKWFATYKPASTAKYNDGAIGVDPDLVFPVVAGGKYIYEMNLLFYGNNTGDIRFGQGGTAIASQWHSGVHGLAQGVTELDGILNHQVCGSASGEASYIVLEAQGVTSYASIKGYMMASTSGNWGLGWAQNTPFGGVGLHLLKGSNLRALRVG